MKLWKLPKIREKEVTPANKPKSYPNQWKYQSLDEQKDTTDVFSYSDTGYSDTPLTVTVWVKTMLPKSITVSKYLLTVTLFPCPKGVTATEDVCNEII